jgi:hypothetical protein
MANIRQFWTEKCFRGAAGVQHNVNPQQKVYGYLKHIFIEIFFSYTPSVSNLYKHEPIHAGCTLSKVRPSFSAWNNVKKEWSNVLQKCFIKYKLLV